VIVLLEIENSDSEKSLKFGKYMTKLRRTKIVPFSATLYACTRIHCVHFADVRENAPKTATNVPRCTRIVTKIAIRMLKIDQFRMLSMSRIYCQFGVNPYYRSRPGLQAYSFKAALNYVKTKFICKQTAVLHSTRTFLTARNVYDYLYSFVVFQ